jgi:hypothetical protein
MRRAYGLGVCVFAFTLFLATVSKSAGASEDKSGSTRISTFNYVEYSPVYNDELESLLYEAVNNRLGLPYRPGGIDDRGYDCSGFVWRVFQDAGISFERGSARTLWETLPIATEDEESLFGTLVFFKGLGHVGIVRDAYSFYHASTSKGVVRSYFDEYWGDRVIGYRRVFAPVKKKEKKEQEKKEQERKKKEKKKKEQEKEGQEKREREREKQKQKEEKEMERDRRKRR